MIKNRIEIDNKTSTNKLSCSFNYMGKEELFEIVRNNPRLKYIQISKNLPREALMTIDSILEIRPDLIFRIYGMYSDGPFDITRLFEMVNIKNLRLDLLEKPGYSRFINVSQLPKLKTINNLYLDVFGSVDLRFLNGFRDINMLYLLIESGSPQIDLSFWKETTLKNIELGKKAVEYAHLIKPKEDRQINKLVLFQSTIEDLYFVQQLSIYELCLINCKIKRQFFPNLNKSVNNLVLANCEYDRDFIDYFVGLDSLKILDRATDLELLN